MLVRAAACGDRIGYSFAAIAIANLIDAFLKRRIFGGNRMNPGEPWSVIIRTIRNLGRPGICSMAIFDRWIAMGDVGADQSIESSEPLIKGQKHGWQIFKTVVKDKIGEVV
jgi:hypothetical protein